MLGALLIAIAIYFTLRQDVGSHRFATWVTVVFMVVSGFFNGLFGIGGPLMALYFLTLADTKEGYLASIQTFFMLDTLYVTSLRVATGVLHLGDLRLVLLGLVYVFIGLSGAYYLISSLLQLV